MSDANAHDLTGHTAVVTGAARGIGRATALQLAAAGADVLVHARQSQEAAEQVVAQIAAMGRRALAVLADLSTSAGQDLLLDRAWQWASGPTIWVNNAGADILTGPLATQPFESKLQALWQVDVLATLRLARAAGERMKAAGGGAIVNVSWDGVEFGMAGDSAQLFAAAKGAITAFTRSLAHSLAPEVRVNCVAPGWIRTGWGQQASPYWQQRAETESLAGRWGSPEDVAQAICYLVAPRAAFINGQTLAVNGGRRAGQDARNQQSSHP